MGKLMKIIQGLRHLISSLTGLAWRMHVDLAWRMHVEPLGKQSNVNKHSQSLAW